MNEVAVGAHNAGGAIFGDIDTDPLLDHLPGTGQGKIAGPRANGLDSSLNLGG